MKLPFENDNMNASLVGLLVLLILISLKVCYMVMQYFILSTNN